MSRHYKGRYFRNYFYVLVTQVKPDIALQLSDLEFLFVNLKGEWKRRKTIFKLIIWYLEAKRRRKEDKCLEKKGGTPFEKEDPRRRLLRNW